MRIVNSLLVSAAILCWAQPASAYVEAPMSLGAIIQQSSNIMIVRVEKVDKEKNMIIFKKVQDLKGKHPTDVIKHNIGRGGFNPREWQYIMEWAESGKVAIFFHNGGASETCLGNYWYQAYAGGEWWNMSHGEPFMLRSYCGKTNKLAQAVTAILNGQEVAVPAMIDGNKEDLHVRRAKIQRLKSSLKLQDYNAKRDFVGWGGGGDEFVRLGGMPGFTHLSGLSRVDPEAQAISSLDIDGDGKPDLCLVGASKIVLIQNGGESLNEIALPGAGGCRAAVWADYNGDGKPDLLLATLTGPKLYTNMGAGNFRDDTHLLPVEPCYDLTAAAWIDHDGDGKPDILLGNGFHGLRLYRNVGAVSAATQRQPIVLGPWHYIGPFDNVGGKGFDRVYPPEQTLNLKQEHQGKGNAKIGWKEGKFKDGEINNLAIFNDNNDAVVYLRREIECTAAMTMPVSLGSDDTLTVWLNGQKIHAENIARAAAPDQARLQLKLKAGKNQLLLKICQGTGEWAYYFKPEINVPPSVTWEFADVSTKVNLGADGIGSQVKGDTLTVADVNGDGRPDFLYGAGSGMLVLNTSKGFVEAKDTGIAYKSGKVGPIFADFNGDGRLDLLVPQRGACKLFRNDGKGKFSDVTAQSGDLAKPIGWATSAAVGDFYNDGRAHLLIGCLRGPNRFFRNLGNGTFKDETETLGLNQRIFNTQAVCLVDLNSDGVLDMIFNNEGQDSVVLLGSKAIADAQRTPVTFHVAGSAGVIGSRIKVVDKSGKAHGVQYINGGEGRGGQKPLQARFALQPGSYRVEVRYSSGLTRAKNITVAGTPLRGVIDDQTPKAE